tara:strand:+ start:1290 stop:2390 length:1101 start_codon:yes stop_codon:yes gene_type:complete
MKIHEKFMKKCLDLAKLGHQKTKTNPLVGCVITLNNKIIADGYHKKYGEEHAEINAINKIQDKSILKKSTIYINLEPCSHYGKTPPCVDSILKYKFKLVVIGTKDPFKKVSGKGIRKLREHTNVIVGVLEKECFALNKTFFINTIFQRPLIVLKWAESKDKFINNYNKGITKISCEESNKLTHKWRSELDGILVGTNTIINDNPQLTCRKSKGKNPIRITIDRFEKLKFKRLNIFNKEAKTIILNLNKTERIGNIYYIKYKESKKSNNQTLLNIMSALYKQGLRSILIEGGEQIINSFMNEEIWDELRIFRSNKILKDGIQSPKLDKVKNNLEKSFYKEIGVDKLCVYENKKVNEKIRTNVLSRSL